MDSWPLKEAETRFGEMLERCLADGPQIVMLDGAEAAVLVPMREWARRVSDAADRADPKCEGGRVVDPHVSNVTRRPTRKEVLTTDFARGGIPIANFSAFRLPLIDFDD